MAIVEFSFGGKAKLYEMICKEHVGIKASDETMRILEQWERKNKRAAAKAATAEGKAKRAVKKARKTHFLQRHALRAGAYTYVTSDERAAKVEDGENSCCESDVETDSGTETHPWGNTFVA